MRVRVVVGARVVRGEGQWEEEHGHLELQVQVQVEATVSGRRARMLRRR